MPDFAAWLSALISKAGASIASAFGATGKLATAISWAAQTIIVGVPLYFTARAMMPKVDMTGLLGRGTTHRNPITSRKIIYGRAKVGGPILYMAEAEYSQSGTPGMDRGNLYVLVGLAGHQCAEIETVYFNDDALTINSTTGVVTAPSRYYPNSSPRATIYTGLVGTTTQYIGTTWGNNTDLDNATDKFKGICCLQVILGYDQEVWVGGVPALSAIVKGNDQLYDPRDASTGWSENPAIILRDYLTNTVYGMGISASMVDDTLISAAANVCDETVSLSGGGTQKRYTCNGTLDTAHNYQQNIETILNSMSGFMVFSNGKFKVYAGEYRTPTVTITEDDLAGPVNVIGKPSKREAINIVRGVAIGEWSNYQPTSYPEVRDSAAVTADGAELVAQLPLPMTNDSTMAQRLAKILLKRSRQQMTLNLSLKLSKFALEPGDTCSVTLESLGIKNKVFEIMQWTFGTSGSGEGLALTVDVQLRETDSSVYDWSTSEQNDPVAVPQIIITNPTSVDTPAFSLTQTQGLSEDGTIIDQVEVNITDPTNNKFVYEYAIEHKESTASNYETTSVLRE